MFVLFGEFSHKNDSLCRRWLGNRTAANGFGRMWARDKVQQWRPWEVWGFDNGAYSCWKNGKPFDETLFLKRLDQALTMPVRTCIVAVTPDIVAAGEKSLEFSLQWIERLPMRDRKTGEGLPWYLAVQNGMTIEMVQQHLPKFAGVFLGGDDAFKRNANEWQQLARSNGMCFHYGRASTIDRVRAAVLIGADSIDSTRPVREERYGRADITRSWIRAASNREPQMELV